MRVLYHNPPPPRKGASNIDFSGGEKEGMRDVEEWNDGERETGFLLRYSALKQPCQTGAFRQ